MIKKVFGIISYFPNNSSKINIETRKERSRRCRELLLKLSELWPDTDILIIAQNWQDFQPPKIKNNLKILYYDRLGILGARKELRKQFLISDYDYLIMLDDDGMIETSNPKAYMDEIDQHPDGMGVIRHRNCPLMLLAISKSMYSLVDMPNVDPEKGEGYEDDLFVATCFIKYPDRCFDFPPDLIQEKSFHYSGPGKCPSTWYNFKKVPWQQISAKTKAEIAKIEKETKQMSKPKKVFGIISYFPDNEGDHYITMRKERRRRCSEFLLKLNEYWPDTDIMFVAQNWQDYQPPEVQNNITIYHYTERLGIVGARKELRKKFLESDYDYMIMVDDDAILTTDNPQAYMDLIDAHPDGFGAVHGFEHGPMHFLAISRYVYSQVDLPDIDPEQGQGFEDDVFFATCISKFPDRQFIVPDGLIIEKSLQYRGPGECPSTWSEEQRYDWKAMRSRTDNRLRIIESNQDYEIPAQLEDSSIDVVITYVNCADGNWVRDYVKATKTHNPSKVRYRSWGTLKYLLRGVERYMPFIRNVVLIVSRASQIPAWLNKENVRIVYHDEFIPKQYLPTFNSCTIESFFWNIPDLADRIIYFNDDVFPNSLMTEEDFFTGDTPHIKFGEAKTYSERSMFHKQCRSSIDMITQALNLPSYEKGKIFRPPHSTMPMTKYCFDQIRELCRNTISPTVTRLRVGKNVNAYIYAYYQYFTNNYVDASVNYKYYDLQESTIQVITGSITNSSTKILCLNDSDYIKDAAKLSRQLTECFEKKFYKKSRFER